MNDILEAENASINMHCRVYTSTSINDWFKTKNIRIKRFDWQLIQGRIIRYVNYLQFNLGVFLSLLFYNPSHILVYETLSLLPIFIISRLKRNTPIHIHYHEYTSRKEMVQGSVYFNLVHLLEKKLWKNKNVSISHTNEDRKRLFLEDYRSITEEKVKIFPNYPPKNWYELSKNLRDVKKNVIPTKLVHVGALSQEATYLCEIVNWVISQNGVYEIDFYTSTISQETKEYLKEVSLKYVFIRLFASVKYYDLPKILSSYNVGLVLYNGHIPNYIYNVPNKVLEYLSCSLQVWYSDRLISTRKFVQEESINDCFEVAFLKLTDNPPQKIHNKYNDKYFNGLQFESKIKNVIK